MNILVSLQEALFKIDSRNDISKPQIINCLKYALVQPNYRNLPTMQFIYNRIYSILNTLVTFKL